jgi:hypothetical protein
MAGRRDLPRIGEVVAGSSAVLPWVVIDTDGDEVGPVSRYLRDRMLGDVSPLTCRSYAHDPLRWFRLLWFLDVLWDAATEAETAVLAGWLRNAENPQRRRGRAGAAAAGSVNTLTGKPEPRPGYAPSTSAHWLSAVFGFYAFHRHFGRGPLANPVPESSSRRKALAHRSPLTEGLPCRRARLRPKLAPRVIRTGCSMTCSPACGATGTGRCWPSMSVPAPAPRNCWGCCWRMSTGRERRSTSSRRGRGPASQSPRPPTRSSTWPPTSARRARRQPGRRCGGRCAELPGRLGDAAGPGARQRATGVPPITSSAYSDRVISRNGSKYVRP